MAKRPQASTSASRPPAAPVYPAARDTARVAVRPDALPGWFWGTLGCLSVLGVGLAVLLLVVRPGRSVVAAPAPPVAAVAAPAAPAAPPANGPGIDIQPFAPSPPPAAPEPAPAPHVHRSHPLKLARTPAGAHGEAAVAAAAGDSDKPPAAAADTAPAKQPADTAASDDDQSTSPHKPAASDEDDDSDD